MSAAPEHPALARQRLRAALELLARHANPPHQPQVQPVDVEDLIDVSALKLDQLDLRGAWLRGLQLDSATWPSSERMAGCEYAEIARQTIGTVPMLAAGHAGVIHALAALPDGRFLSAGIDGSVRLWSPERPDPLARFAVHEGGVLALGALPDERFLSAGAGGAVLLWSPECPEPLAQFAGHEGRVRALAVLPDGRFLSAGLDNTVRLWSPERPEPLAQFALRTGGVRALAVLPGGRFLSAGDDDTVWLRSLERLEPLAQFAGHESGVLALAVLPDGRFLSAGRDAVVRRWNLATGCCDALWAARPGLFIHASAEGIRYTRDSNAPWQTIDHQGHVVPWTRCCTATPACWILPGVPSRLTAIPS